MATDQNLDVEAVDTPEVSVPEWVPDKFKSNPEEFGKAYVNLEREFHQTRQDLRAQQEQLEAFIAEQNQPAPVQPNTDAIYQAYENDPVGTMAYLAQQAAAAAIAESQKTQQQFTQPLLEQQNQLLAYTANQIVAQKLPDWGDYQEKVGDWISQNPDLLSDEAFSTPDRAAKTLEVVYNQVRNADLLNQNKTLAEQQAELQRQAKLASQTLTGSPGRPAPQDGDNEYWERVMKAPRGGL